MSLKAFHVFFVLVATIFSAGFAFWSFRHFLQQDGGTLYLFLGAISLAATLGLIAYGRLFLKKMKDVSYL